MTVWPLLAASSPSEWTLYSTLEIALPAAAILISAAIALYVSRRAYQGALKAQVEAARIEREHRAHDELLAVLGQFIEWFVAARKVARAAALGWRAQHKMRDWQLEHLPQLESSEAVESDSDIILEASKVLEAAGSLRDAARWVRDSAVFFPIRGDVLFYLDILGPSIAKFWGRVDSLVADPPGSRKNQEQDLERLKDAVRYMGFVTDFCKELRVLVHNSELRKYGGTTRPALEKWHWLRDEEGLWGFGTTPPYLLGVFVEEAAAEMKKQFASEPLETHRFGESSD